MRLTSRSLIAIAALIAVEGIVILGALALHGGVNWAEIVGVIVVALASAAVAVFVVGRSSR